MKIVLINPPSSYLENDAAYPPMGLMYLATPLEQAGHDVAILDLTGSNDWKSKVEAVDADLVGVTCVTPNYNVVKEIFYMLPQQTPKMVGGVHPTHMPSEVHQDLEGAIVVCGEADCDIVKIAKDVQNGKCLHLYDCSRCYATHKPARHLVDLHKYAPGGENATPVYTSRGCPYNCTFCSKITGQKLQCFDSLRVVEEIKEVQELGFDKIVFGDDNIAANIPHLYSILKAVAPLDITFRLNMDSRHVTLEMLRRAKEAGCTEISMGIESGSQKILNLMNKQTTVVGNKRAIAKIKEAGITAKAYFMVNFPGETETTVSETIDFIREVQPDKSFLSAFAPLPGSYIFDHPKEYGISWMSSNWSDYYLVGKEFVPCFMSVGLTIRDQTRFYQTLRQAIEIEENNQNEKI